MTDLVYQTADVVAAINEVEKLPIAFNEYIANSRFYFVDSILYASGLKIEVSAAQAAAGGIDASVEDLSQGGSMKVRAAGSTEKAAQVIYEKFPAPLTLYYSAFEMRREGLSRNWRVAKKGQLLTLGNDRTIQDLEWMGDGQNVDITVDD